MTPAQTVVVIWSVAGGVGAVVIAIGSMIKWNCRDSYDVQIEQERTKRMVLEHDRERRLLG